MDFLATVKKRLEELEEQARQMQALEQETKPASKKASSALFQPRSKTKERGGARKSVSPQSPARSLASQDGFVTPECATGGVQGKALQGKTSGEPAGSLGKPLNRRLVDDLRGRLDEAFLLSEVLGKPRCVRGWDDD